MAHLPEEDDFEVARRLQEEEIKRAAFFQDIEKQSKARTEKMREEAMRKLKEQSDKAMEDFKRITGGYGFGSSNSQEGATANPATNGTKADTPDDDGIEEDGGSPTDSEEDDVEEEAEEEEEEEEYPDGSDQASNSVDDSLKDLIARGLLPATAVRGTGGSDATAASSRQDTQKDAEERPRRNSFGMYCDESDSQDRRNSLGRRNRRPSIEDMESNPNRPPSMENLPRAVATEANPRRRPSWENLPRRPSVENLLGAVASEANPRRRPSWESLPRRPSVEDLPGAVASEANPRRRPSWESLQRRPSVENLAGAGALDTNPHRRSSLDNTPQQPSVPSSAPQPSLRELANADASVVAAAIQQAMTTQSAQIAAANAPRRNAASTGTGASSDPQFSLQLNRPFTTRQDFKGLVSNFEAGIHSLVPSQLAEDGLPEDWDRSLPYANASGLFQLQELQAGDDIFEAVSQDFIRAGLEAVKVERLQNAIQVNRFKGELDIVKRTHSSSPGFELNVQYLYHGTTADKLCLCEEGLDSRLGYQGCFGRGIYFSDHPKKCMQYAKDKTNTRGLILMCRVILGESKIYPKGHSDPKLKREPEKLDAATKGGWRYYDSVIGCPVDFNEYVVYQNPRVMIEYIVTFKQLGLITPDHPKAAMAQALLGVPPPSLLIPKANGQMDYPDDDDYEEHMSYIASIREEMKMQKAKEKGVPYVPSSDEELHRNRQQWNRRLLMHCPVNSPIYQGAVRDMNGLPAKPSKAPRAPNARVTVSSSSSSNPSSNSASASALPSTAATARNNASSTSPSAVTMWSSSSLSGSATCPRAGADQRASSSAAPVAVAPAEPGDGDEDDAIQQLMSSLIADFLSITNTDDVAMARSYLTSSNMVMDAALMAYYDNS